MNVDWSEWDPTNRPVNRLELPMQNPWYKRYAKAILGLIGTATPQTVFALLEQNGVHTNPWINLAVTTGFAVAAIAGGPKNAPKA